MSFVQGISVGLGLALMIYGLVRWRTERVPKLVSWRRLGLPAQIDFRFQGEIVVRKDFSRVVYWPSTRPVPSRLRDEVMKLQALINCKHDSVMYLQERDT